jgi:hypothetical protein
MLVTCLRAFEMENWYVYLLIRVLVVNSATFLDSSSREGYVEE